MKSGFDWLAIAVLAATIAAGKGGIASEGASPSPSPFPFPFFSPSPSPSPQSPYFQQSVAYRIEARLDEATSVLAARARMRYGNRSPQSIDTLWFHLHLNAFRPNSAWARRDLAFGNRRFQDLGPDDHAFERVQSVTVDGTAVRPVFPGAPDSSVMAVPLPRLLPPGQELTVGLDWQARLATLARRQGRRGRHYDFAQWYPRIAVYDRDGWEVQPLLPQGEFYGEFASFDLTLDLAADQVVGATGVPVEGDPGWSAARAPGQPEPDLKREAYAARPAEPLGLLASPPAAGRKRIRWRAENVHHFAWTTNPAYIFEGGAFEDVAIRVLYQPGDTAWRRVAVERTASALAFLDTLFGDFPWPQLTNVHRIEGGGTEFPMMVMDGSASEGLIMHEVGHNYVHGVLANNEWREGWLDEGFSSFVTSWYSEERGADPRSLWAGSLRGIRALDGSGASQPISLASAEFRDPQMYSAMTYNKPAIVYRMLRELVGEPAFRRGLRLYYERNRLRHVREADFRAALEEASGRDLGWFFEQWIHTTGTLDWSVGAVSTRALADGRFETAIEVLRAGDIWMPVRLRVGEVERRVEGRERRQVVTVTTAARPAEAVLDPDDVLLDIDPTNNRKAIGP
jgi:hypothetical protein